MDASGGNHHWHLFNFEKRNFDSIFVYVVKTAGSWLSFAIADSAGAYFHGSYTSVNILTVWHATLTSNASLGGGRGRSRWVGGGGGDGRTVAMDLN